MAISSILNLRGVVGCGVGAASLLPVLIMSHSASAHLCGPPSIEVNVGESVSWQITADLTEVESLYTILTPADPAIVDVTWPGAPANPFIEHHGDFEITGVAEGSTFMAVHWFYEPTNAGATCLVEIIVHDVQPPTADFNSDGVVDVSDLLVLLSSWGSCGSCGADLNDDDVVDVTDLLVLLSSWGPVNTEPCCNSPVCEPNDDIEPTFTFDEALAVPNCGDNFGLSLAAGPGSINGEFTACCVDDGDAWKIKVVSMDSAYWWDVCNLGRTEIFTIGQVDNTNCAAIITDFTPVGATPAAPYVTYVHPLCVAIHEETHIDEWKASFEAAWEAEEPVIEALTVECSPEVPDAAAAVAALQAQIDARVNNARMVASANWPDDPPGPSQAYPNENACLLGFIQLIHQQGFLNCPGD